MLADRYNNELRMVNISSSTNDVISMLSISTPNSIIFDSTAKYLYITTQYNGIKRVTVSTGSLSQYSVGNYSLCS